MMKGYSLFLILTVLFLSDYALAAAVAPPCLCDTTELPGGLSGNEIVDIVCPGGTLSEDSIFVLEPDQTRISLAIPPNTTYLTRENNVGDFFCEINTDGVLPVTL
jgi:hypothetical protein